jgi:hypothetical protein
MNVSLRFRLVLVLSLLGPLMSCARFNAESENRVGTQYVAYRHALQDFEVSAYALAMDPGPGGYMETENKMVDIANSLSNKQRLDSAQIVLQAYEGPLKNVAGEMDNRLDRLKDAGLNLIEAVHRLPERVRQPFGTRIEEGSSVLSDDSDKLAGSLHSALEVRKKLLKEVIDEKGNVAGVFARRIRQKDQDDWPRIQGGLKEKFNEFNQRKEQLRRDYAAFKGEARIAVDFDDANPPAR